MGRYLFKNLFVVLFAVSLVINSVSFIYYSEFVGRRCTCTSQNPPDPSTPLPLALIPTQPESPKKIPDPTSAPTSEPAPELTPEFIPEPIPEFPEPIPEPNSELVIPIPPPLIPRPFSLYVLELSPEITETYHGWVDPLHTAFLNSSFRTMEIDHADFVIVPYYQTQAWSCILSRLLSFSYQIIISKFKYVE